MDRKGLNRNTYRSPWICGFALVKWILSLIWWTEGRVEAKWGAGLTSLPQIMRQGGWRQREKPLSAPLFAKTVVARDRRNPLILDDPYIKLG